MRVTIMLLVVDVLICWFLVGVVVIMMVATLVLLAVVLIISVGIIMIHYFYWTQDPSLLCLVSQLPC